MRSTKDTLWRRVATGYDRRVFEDVADRLRAFFAAHGDGVAAAYLFGSVARGTAGPDSDVDVAILPSEPSAGTLASLRLDLEADLERDLGAPTQLVVLDRAPSDLVHRVLRDGILVHEADRAHRIAFEVQARNEFFDMQPILQRYRRGPA